MSEEAGDRLRSMGSLQLAVGNWGLNPRTNLSLVTGHLSLYQQSGNRNREKQCLFVESLNYKGENVGVDPPVK